MPLLSEGTTVSMAQIHTYIHKLKSFEKVKHTNKTQSKTKRPL